MIQAFGSLHGLLLLTSLHSNIGASLNLNPDDQLYVNRPVSTGWSGQSGCTALDKAIPGSVVQKPSREYTLENKDFWSLTEILSPSCIFKPKTAQDIGTAIKLLQQSNASFAVRSGGHMGITGANNIDDGVLMVMSELKALELNADKSVLSIGPAWKWNQVYEQLEPHNLAVQGGRVSPIGVPGLLLGGGISFYGNARGFACDDVINFEVVLADGSIQNANATNNPDSYFALKGGSSNFGIVTRFDMLTFPGAKVWGGVYSVDAPHIPALLDAVANYTVNSKDPKSACIPAVLGTDPPVGAAIIFYDSDNERDANPLDLQPFTDIPSVASTVSVRTLRSITDENAQAVIPNIK